MLQGLFCIQGEPVKLPPVHRSFGELCPYSTRVVGRALCPALCSGQGREPGRTLKSLSLSVPAGLCPLCLTLARTAGQVPRSPLRGAIGGFVPPPCCPHAASASSLSSVSVSTSSELLASATAFPVYGSSDSASSQTLHSLQRGR